jgi:DNA repair exonuclease SbcCD ATPase subunit
MKLELPERDWKAMAPSDFQNDYKSIKNLVGKCKDPESLKTPKELLEAASTAAKIGKELDDIFDAVKKAIKDPNQRKPYNSLNSNWRQRIADYRSACDKQRQVLEDAPKKNSERILKEIEDVYEPVEKTCADLVKQSEKIYKEIKERQRKIDGQLDKLSAGKEDGLDIIQGMKLLEAEARKEALLVANMVLKVDKLISSEWIPVYKKDQSELTSDHKKQATKMKDAIQRHSTQINKNEEETDKVVNQCKESVLRGGGIYQGQVSTQEALLAKLKRLNTALKEEIADCENRSAYDASGRIDSCEGDLNKLEGREKATEEEKKKIRAGLDQLVNKTEHSMNLLHANIKNLKDMKKRLEEATPAGFQRINPDLNKELNDHYKSINELSKTADKYQKKFEDVQKRVRALP